jgi:hypothetical protein
MADFLFVLSQDNADKATRCFQFAKIAHEKGHKANMVLDGGPHLIDLAAEAKVFNF